MNNRHQAPITGPEFSRRSFAKFASATVAAFSVAVIAACSNDDVPDAGPAAGSYVSGDGRITTWEPDQRKKPVELSGKTYKDKSVDLAKMRGNVVVVNFWYASCPPCRAEAPDLAKLSRNFAKKGVEFLGVNHTDDGGTALAFERSFDIPYPSLNDKDADGVAAMQGVVPLRAMPSTVVLDRDGKVAARIIGQADPSTLKALINQTLDEKA